MTPTDGGVTIPELLLPDVAALADVATFVGRAAQVDPVGAVRLVAQGQVLAMYAGALHGGGAPTVLALRVLTLGRPTELDVTVACAALLERLGPIEQRSAGPGAVRSGPRAPANRPGASSASSPHQLTPGSVPDGGSIRLPIPAGSGTGATWAGILPPRSGWSLEGVIRRSELRRAARAGIDEVAAGAPQGSGAAAVARLRAMVWGRPLAGHGELPTGAAFAAETFGFLGGGGGASGGRSRGERAAEEEVFDQDASQDVVSVHRVGPWWRLSATRGHVLARLPVRLQ